MNRNSANKRSAATRTMEKGAYWRVIRNYA